MKRKLSLIERFPPSPPCSCDVCVAYCRRPGWWTVKEAERAIEAGYARRMMLELSPDRSLGVLSPAFRGNEGTFAYSEFSSRGCTFLKDGGCELHDTRFQPLECRFCHHDRRGEGPRCHRALEKDWNSPAGRSLVSKWARMVGLLCT
ncbi:MAG TPA: hypothetical protein VK886_01300 [Vicinamibacterales bacterium]|nr:hypothetical protein [Vicinamibacterales bacterium]